MCKSIISIAKNVHEQKRLLLVNLRELFVAFKSMHPSISIGFSKFCSLRPKCCITVSRSGTHSVCVCSIHQNAKLLAAACGCDYHDLMSKLVCDLSNKDCMLHRCEKCPGLENLEMFLLAKFEESGASQVTFQQWDSTDRCSVITRMESIDTFIDIVLKSINNLTKHSFVAKSQSNDLKAKKSSLDPTEAVVLLDFAENYSFIAQDSIQGYHWNNAQCSLHPAVIYFFDNKTNSLSSKSMCIISENLDHDVAFVYSVQKVVMKFLKINFYHVSTVHYYSDGCSAQYKNYKNLMILCHHHKDFGLNADWTFFATSHGKSPCDGVGGTVKCLVSRASLQHPINNQILTAESFFEFCQENISGISFDYLTTDSLVSTRVFLNERFLKGNTIPGTRSFHYFTPLDEAAIGCKFVSCDSE